MIAGKRIEQLAKGLGMSTLIADRKTSTTTPPPGRMSFADVMSKSSVIVLCCPLTAETRDVISEPELRSMQSDAIVINVARGGVVNEPALVRALKEGWIGGAATDVFEIEPSSKDLSPLLHEDVPNFVATPHLAWYAESTAVRLKTTVTGNVEAFVAGKVQNAVVGGPP
jgi:phosphoglycerate dehydrogenase-like enzyme